MAEKNRPLFKQGCIILMLVIVCIGSVYGLEWDNIKSYDAATKTVTITNAFGLGSDVAKIKLLTPEHNKIWGTGNMKVAEIQIESFDAYNDALQKIQFYSKTNDVIGKEITGKGFTYKYKTTKLQEVDKWDSICQEPKNGTANCVYQVVGKETKNVEVWEDLTGTNIPKGTITIGIWYSDVQAGVTIEWIPTMFGERIDEWTDFTGYTLGEFNTDAAGVNNFQVPDIYAQGFLIGGIGANVTGIIKGVGIGFKIDATTKGFMNVSIYSTNSGDSYKPQTQLSINKTLNITTDMGVMHEYNVTMPDYTFSPGEHLALLYIPGSGTHRLAQSGETNPYPAGKYWYSADYGSTWADNGNYDTYFKIYYEMTTYPVFYNEVDTNGTLTGWGVTDFSVNINDTNGTAWLTINNTKYTATNISNLFTATANFTRVNADTTYMYNWTSYGSGTAHNLNVSNNRYYTILGTYLNITLNSPANLSQLFNPVTFNCTAKSTETITNISLWIDNAIDTTNTGGSIYEQKNLTAGNHNWTCESWNSLERKWAGYNNTLTILNYNVTSFSFNATTAEGNYESYYLNLTYDTAVYSLGTAYFYYGNTTSYLASSTSIGKNATYYKLNFAIPTVTTSGTLIPIHFEFSLSNSSGSISYYNSSFQNQTVNKGIPITVGICGSGYSAALNFTFNHEENLTLTNVSLVNYYVTYGLAGNTSLYSINSSLTDQTDFAICINNSQGYYNIGYGEIQYSDATTDDRRYYVFSGTRITNATVNIPLYTIDSGHSTSFLITAETSTLIPYVNHYIGLLRWYPSINSYSVVEMGRTDDKGQTVLHVVVEDVDYRLALYESDGTLVELLAPIRLVCQTTPCVYTIYTSAALNLVDYLNIAGALSYDAANERFIFTWNDPTQTSQTMNLTAYKESATASEVICSAQSSGYTGTMLCSITGQTGRIRAVVIRTASPGTIFAQLIEEIGSTFIDAGGGGISLLIGAILLIFFALIGTVSPVLVIILGLVSLIPLWLLGSISWMVLMAIGVLGGVVLHFIGRTTK